MIYHTLLGHIVRFHAVLSQEAEVPLCYESSLPQPEALSLILYDLGCYDSGHWGLGYLDSLAVSSQFLFTMSYSLGPVCK